jgi:DNA (cytosine-5)-methyltransferase 1
MSDAETARRSMLETSAFLGTQQYEEPTEVQQRIGYTDPPTHVSLFSGIGGFDLGFAQAGFENLVAVEADEHAADTFRRNLIDGDELHQDEPELSDRIETIQEVYVGE